LLRLSKTSQMWMGVVAGQTGGSIGRVGQALSSNDYLAWLAVFILTFL
jgi:hypothetical protein